MNLTDLYEPHAARDPGRSLFIFRDKKITFKEFSQTVLRCAQGLSELGIKKGSTFAIIVRNSPEFAVLAMALSKLGAVAVPINFLEKSDRIALILNDAQAVGVLTAKEFYRHVATAAKSVPTLKHCYLRDGAHKEFKSFEDLLQKESWTGKTEVTENDLMMLLYTSGTTGLPKGVMLTHKNFLANVDQCLRAIDLKPSDVFICLLPLFHSFSYTTCLLIPFKLGAMVVVNESLLPFDPVIKAIWKHKVTLFVAVPQIFSALTQKIKGLKAVLIRFLNPVRLCISGAAPLPPAVQQAFEKTFRIPLLEGYGLTETAPVATLNPEKKRKVGTVGLPLPGVSISIRDDQGDELPQGQVGEIWIWGDNVMKGYYNKPRETAEVLTPEGWLKTGDMGLIDEDGYVKIVDRKKDLIIIKGLNVYPQEIESVIAEDPAVREVAVVGKMDLETGDETIRAFVTAVEGAGIDKSRILALCRERLAAYKRPKEIILLDQMPKNALQKILKKDLRQRP